MPIPFRTALIAASALLSAAASATPLTGMWGAGDALLAIDTQGGRLQLGCTLVRFAPVEADASGQFATDARAEKLQVMLPEEDEAETPSTPARLTGRLGGGRVELTLTVQGQAPRTVQLVAGQRGKPARCL